MITTREEFNEISEKWKNETMFHSSMKIIYKNEHYQTLRKMGPEIVPFMLENFRDDEMSPVYFHLLKEKTGIDPTAPDHYGYITKLKSDWVKWE